MKYIYILGLLVLVIICCLIGIKENLIPAAALAQIQQNEEGDLIEETEPPPPDTNPGKLKKIIDGSTLPTTGVVSGGVSYEKKPQRFEIEDQKCQEIKFCENLTENMNCGYCLQDDLEGLHPFHYGDEKGPYTKRGSNKESLCKTGVNRDGKETWISPSRLNGKKQKELEAELNLIKEKYRNHPQHPEVLAAELNFADKMAHLGIEDTGYSGCAKMRERYICSRVNQCSPMNFEMFGINAKDICGFCVDDGKAMVRQDLPDLSKFFTQTKYVSDPKCENIEIFGDGVDCKSHNKNKERCLGQRSIEDPEIPACAYNYNSKQVKYPIYIPKPSIPKYGKTKQSKIYDKCESEWGLIRPSQCDWFETVYPCIKSKSGGPHSDKCLQSLWQQMGFQTNYKLLSENGEQNIIDSWHRIDVDSVLASMESLYSKIFSQDYKVAKKWVKLCYGLDVNVCNRAGFITEKYPSQYWKETSDPCMSLLYKYSGGKPDGLANPTNTKKMSYAYLGSTKTPSDATTEEEINKDIAKWRNGGFRENRTELEQIGSVVPEYTFLRAAKTWRQRDYVNKIRELSQLKNMSHHKAAKVRRTDDHSSARNDDRFSNVRWVDKLISSKLITGKKPIYPVSEEKPCWPDFARRMLTHPQVKLFDLKTLSFQTAEEFHTLSEWGDNSPMFENMRRSGNRFFEGGNRWIISKRTYEQDTFPYWKWMEVSDIYWSERWGDFKTKLVDYEGTSEIDLKTLMRPTNENTARQLAKAAGLKLGGRRHSWTGGYSTKGLYSVSAGHELAGAAFFGTGGSKAQMQAAVPWPQIRFLQNHNYAVIKFTPDSRFYNVLPETLSIQDATTKPKLFALTENGTKNKYLFESSYHRPKYPYYKFLNLISKH